MTETTGTIYPPEPLASTPKHVFLRDAVSRAAWDLNWTSRRVEVEKTFAGADMYVASHRLTIRCEVDLGDIKISVLHTATGERLQHYVLDNVPREVLGCILTTIVNSLA